MAMISNQTYLVWLDYSHFYLHSAQPEHARQHPPDDPVEIVHRALSTGIAQGGYTTVVVTPHHDNVDMVLSVQLWDTEPDDDIAEWEEAFEASITAAETGIVFESPTMACQVISIPSGSYRVRICGHAFFRQRWKEGDPIHYDDNYRFQFWPQTHAIKPHRIKLWDHPPNCGHI